MQATWVYPPPKYGPGNLTVISRIDLTALFSIMEKSWFFLRQVLLAA